MAIDMAKLWGLGERRDYGRNTVFVRIKIHPRERDPREIDTLSLVGEVLASYVQFKEDTVCKKLNAR